MQPGGGVDQGNLADFAGGRSGSRAHGYHEVAAGREERPRQAERRLGASHGPHGHGSEGVPVRGHPGQGFRPGLFDGDPGEPQESRHVAEKVGAFAVRLDKRDRPFGAGQLEDEAGHAGAAPDIEQRRRRDGKDRQPEQGVEEKVLDALGLGPVAREPAHAAPARQLGEVAARPGVESALHLDAQGRDAPGKNVPGVQG